MSVSKLLELGSNIIHAMTLCIMGLKKTMRQSGSALTEFQPFCLLAHSHATRGEGSNSGHRQREIMLCDSNNDDNILQDQERMIYETFNIIEY